MKKSLVFLFLITFYFTSFAGEPPKEDLKALNKTLSADVAAKAKEIEVLKDSLNLIPDSTCVTLKDGSTICLPFKDSQLLADSVAEYVKKNTSTGWPKDILGWLSLIVGLFMGAEGARRLSAGKKIYEALKPVLKTRLGLAVVFSALLSAVITAVLGAFKAFDWNLFITVWPWLAIGASYIYEVFYKDKPKK